MTDDREWVDLPDVTPGPDDVPNHAETEPDEEAPAGTEPTEEGTKP